MRRINKPAAGCLSACLLIIAAAVNLYALTVPELKGRVNDYADMLSPQAERAIESRLRGLEQSDSTQVVVLTIPSLEGDALENFSIRVAEKWKIGQKGLDNGAILLISRDDRKVRIEVGYGLEGKLTDLMAGRIIDNIIVPEFRKGDFEGGIIEGIKAIESVVRGEFDASQAERKGPSPPPASYLPVLFFLMFLIGIIGSISKKFGAVAGGVIFPLAGIFLFSISFWLLLLIPAGILAGLIMPGLTRGVGSGGGYMMGGFGGGGFGGGGFSGGGFSGGGGGFGGGGASGGW